MDSTSLSQPSTLLASYSLGVPWSLLHTHIYLFISIRTWIIHNAHGLKPTMGYRPQAPAAQFPPASLKSLNPAILGPRRSVPDEPPILYPVLCLWRPCCLSIVSRAAAGSKIVLKNKAITSSIFCSHRISAVKGPGLSVTVPIFDMIYT